MTILYVIRHGETDWNREGRIQGHEDIELNQFGEEQAHKCGSFLCGEKIDLIISSPLKRAYKTSTIIAQYLQISEVQTLAELRERDFGQSSGLTRAQRTLKFPNGDIPDIEPWDQFRDRVMEGIQFILRLYPDKKVTVVAHGGVINALLHAISDGEIGTGVTMLKNACLTVLHFRDSSGWEIEKHNDIAHL